MSSYPAVWQTLRNLYKIPNKNTTVKSNGPFRPPQWAQASYKTRFLMTVQYPSGVLQSGVNEQSYVFDAVISLTHGRRLTKTSHPVQSGASLSDHAYMEPRVLVIEIGMSDAMAAFDAAMYTSDPSKSVSAYQTLCYIQSLRTPIKITTRLDSYTNMLIENIDAHDDVRTFAGLRATIRFSEVIIGSVIVTPTSTRSQTSNSTNEGNKQPATVDPGLSKYLHGIGG